MPPCSIIHARGLYKSRMHSNAAGWVYSRDIIADKSVYSQEELVFNQRLGESKIKEAKTKEHLNHLNK
jgi:hypothetical protein